MDTTQLLKGVLDVAVLAVLEREDGYGYDVLRRLRAGGMNEVGDASVYGTLRRFTPPARSRRTSCPPTKDRTASTTASRPPAGPSSPPRPRTGRRSRPP